MAALVGQLQQGYAQLVGGMTDGYEQLVSAIIRPPRDIYNVADLGRKRFRFMEVLYSREDVQLPSMRSGQPSLECSHYKPEPVQGQEMPERPCVIYLHGNSSSRTESLNVLQTVLNAGADLFSFDFAGSGLSGGKYVSLGHFEKEDLATVVKHLRSSSNVSTIGLWGRSMGAATALMHGDTDPSIAAMVLDSPFTDLRTLALDLCQKETYGSVPSWLADATLSILRRTIQQRAGFDLDDLSPISHAERTFIPAIFAVADGDDFIFPYHSRKLREAYGGESVLLSMDGDHNSKRPEHFEKEVEKFFLRTLHVNLSGRQKDALLASPPSPAPLPSTRWQCDADSESPLPPPPMVDVAYAPIPIPEPGDEEAQQERPRHQPPQRQPESSPKHDIRIGLIGLGFSSEKADAALRRSSTLEGCVDWIVANGG